MSNEIEIYQETLANPEQVRAVLQRAEGFRAVIQQTLKPGTDYGTIPGTNSKPVLLKPGAEKILMALGIRSEFTIEQAITDWERPFFYYRVRCSLYKAETLITEGLGSANSNESKFRRNNPADVENTVLKMAKKRALVDAVLLVASLSDVFTQDMEPDEDIGNIGNVSITAAVVDAEPQNNSKEPAKEGAITWKQARRVYALAKGRRDIVDMVLAEYGYENLEQLPRSLYEEFCNRVELLAQSPAADHGEVDPEKIF